MIWKQRFSQRTRLLLRTRRVVKCRPSSKHRKRQRQPRRRQVLEEEEAEYQGRAGVVAYLREAAQREAQGAPVA